jgi:hypothetical protein
MYTAIGQLACYLCPLSVTQTEEACVERRFPSDSAAIKVLVNFLQITAILRDVTAALPQPIVRLLDAAGVVSSGVQTWVRCIDALMHLILLARCVDGPALLASVSRFCMCLHQMRSFSLRASS